MSGFGNHLKSTFAENFRVDTGYFKKMLDRFKAEGRRCFATSSFQTQSVPLLHLLARYASDIPIYFLDTGYLFPETHAFKNTLIDSLGIRVIGLRSEWTKAQQLDEEGQLLYISDPDYCCDLNKVKPLEAILIQHDIWINGIRSDQGEQRRRMHVFEDAPYQTRRYHPMLHWTKKDIWKYIREHNLPYHPLDVLGYQSIGCMPCTRAPLNPEERDGRWFGLNKTECGLHTTLLNEKKS
jgi:phosphoadenosine phosphosulfate reductase